MKGWMSKLISNDKKKRMNEWIRRSKEWMNDEWVGE